MAKRGTKPKPPELKVIDGNPSKRPIPTDFPKPPPVAPPCPAWLDYMAKCEWKRVVPLLESLGLMSHLDKTALASYCNAFSRMRKAQKVLDKEGLTFETPNGYLQQRPEVGIINQCTSQIRAFCAEFGMTPSARGRMVTGHGKGDKDPEWLPD